MNNRLFLFFAVAFMLFSPLAIHSQQQHVIVGAARVSEYAPLLAGKRVALLGNHTSMVGQSHTLDVMLDNGINVTTIFSPEHGFRGSADAGEHVSSSVDAGWRSLT